MDTPYYRYRCRIGSACLLIALALLLSACAPPEPPPPGTEALDQVVTFTEETAEQIAPTDAYTGTELPDSPRECKPWWAVNPGRIWGYVVLVDLDASPDTEELFSAIYDYWTDAGYRVQGRTLNTDPSMFATDQEGYSYRVELTSDERQVQISGSTPCIPAVNAE